MSRHDRVARRIAQQHDAEYNQGAGADIQAEGCAIEVETMETVGDAARQLSGYRKPVFVAGTSQKAVDMAVEHYEGTSIGVMDGEGNIVKESTRGG